MKKIINFRIVYKLGSQPVNLSNKFTKKLVIWWSQIKKKHHKNKVSLQQVQDLMELM